LDSHYGKVFIVHRLDKDTSGLLIVARSPSSHKFLNDQFNLRSVEKEYHAVVISHESFPPRLSVNQPLRVNGDRRHRTIVDGKAGKPAETHFELLESFGNITLVRAIPKLLYASDSSSCPFCRVSTSGRPSLLSKVNFLIREFEFTFVSTHCIACVQNHFFASTFA